MNEKATKKEINYVEPVIVVGESDVVTYIGEARGASEKFGVVFPVFMNGTEIDWDAMKNRYDMSPLDFVQAGVRQISTRPNYDAAFTPDGCDQNKLQEIADGYKPGRQASTGPKVTKEKAKVARQIAKDTPDDMTPEEMAELKAKLAEIKARRG